MSSSFCPLFFFAVLSVAALPAFFASASARSFARYHINGGKHFLLLLFVAFWKEKRGRRGKDSAQVKFMKFEIQIYRAFLLSFSAKKKEIYQSINRFSKVSKNLEYSAKQYIAFHLGIQARACCHDPIKRIRGRRTFVCPLSRPFSNTENRKRFSISAACPEE